MVERRGTFSFFHLLKTWVTYPLGQFCGPFSRLGVTWLNLGLVTTWLQWSLGNKSTYLPSLNGSTYWLYPASLNVYL